MYGQDPGTRNMSKELSSTRRDTSAGHGKNTPSKHAVSSDSTDGSPTTEALEAPPPGPATVEKPLSNLRRLIDELKAWRHHPNPIRGARGAFFAGAALLTALIVADLPPTLQAWRDAVLALDAAEPKDFNSREWEEWCEARDELFSAMVAALDGALKAKVAA
jgi:hypothetical protein